MLREYRENWTRLYSAAGDEKVFSSGGRKPDFLKIGYNIPCLVPISEDDL